MPRVSAPKVAPNLDWVVVEREFELRKGRKQTKVLARFGKPVRGRRDFRCEFQIAGLLDKPIAGQGFGVDGVQALELAMQAATIELLSSRAYQSGRLTFFGSHDLRMPLPRRTRFLTRWDLEAKRIAKQSRAGSDSSARAHRSVFAEGPTGTAIRAGDAPVIVERDLELRRGRKRTKVRLRFRQPVRHRHGFGCAFHIEGLLDKPPSRSGMSGTDGIEALHNAMKLAMVYILSSRAYQRGRLTWCEMYDLGLPVPEEIAPLIRQDLNAARFAQAMMVPPATRAAQLRQHLRKHPDLRRDFDAMVAELKQATGSTMATRGAEHPGSRSTTKPPRDRRATGRTP